MYAIHLTPSGSTYTAEKEEFVARNALPLTDMTIGKDGAIYFAVGGRGGQSELYRVTYTGTEATDPVDAKMLSALPNEKSVDNSKPFMHHRKIQRVPLIWH